MSRFTWCAAICAIFLASSMAHGAIIVNEFMYDDGGTDDRGFIELYNNGVAAESIGGWTLGGQDQVGANTSVTITAGTTLAPGAFYVVGMTGLVADVANVSQVNALAMLENDSETIELRNGAALVDAVVYESFRGATVTTPTNGGHGVLPGDVQAQVGPGIIGTLNPPDVAAAPSTGALSSFGRFVDGRDTNNNGRDFGMRPFTPGTANSVGGYITTYTPPDPTGQTIGANVPGLSGSFVPTRFFDPTVATVGLNPNVIAPAPFTGNRAMIVYDVTGGGNAASANQAFSTTQGAFGVYAFLETSPLPQQFTGSTTAPVNFAGSELTIYGIGGLDGSVGLTDLAGNLGLAAGVLPSLDTSNGLSGVAWVYERTAANGATPAKEILYLVDAGQGGDASQGGNTPLAWTILQSLDISGLASNWFNLGISIDASGNGVGYFNGNSYNFTTSTNLHSGAFNVGYRENLSWAASGTADATPEALMRPATFTIPEPCSLALLGAFGIVALGAYRRR
jgi:hypothetical protein